MASSETRPAPDEDRHRGSHGGDGRRGEPKARGRSSQAAGKDPGRVSADPAEARRPAEDRIIDPPKSGPPAHDLGPGAGPPGSTPHRRGWREGDEAADEVLPAREHGAGGGKVDGPRR